MAAATGTLTVVNSVSLTISGVPHVFSNTQTLTAVTNPYDQIVSVPITEVVILTIAAANAGATFKNINFLYLENKDTVNTCRIRFKDTGLHTFDITLDAGRSLTLWNNKLNVDEDASAWSAFTNWDEVSADFDTLEGELHVFACQV